MHNADVGLDLTTRLTGVGDDVDVVRRLHARGLTATPLSPCYLGPPPQHGLLLGFGGARGIPAAGLALTARRARSERLVPPGVPAPDSVPGLSAAAVRDGAGFELFYPGAGHAPDNVVAYFPAQRVLFGGCLVRADTATTVGNVADADVDHWPRAVARVRAAYPDARLVVPGHGAASRASALAWTERLVTEKGAAARRASGG